LITTVLLYTMQTRRAETTSIAATLKQQQQQCETKQESRQTTNAY